MSNLLPASIDALAKAIRAMDELLATREISPIWPAWGERAKIFPDHVAVPLHLEVMRRIGWELLYPWMQKLLAEEKSVVTSDELNRLDVSLNALHDAIPSLNKFYGTREVAGNIAAIAAMLNPAWASVRDALAAEIVTETPGTTPEFVLLGYFLDGGSVFDLGSVEAQVRHAGEAKFSGGMAQA